ncbi:MAG: hypothetical protein ABEJ07_05295 [Candidatus Nanohaloarchaea archaeon]
MGFLDSVADAAGDAADAAKDAADEAVDTAQEAAEDAAEAVGAEDTVDKVEDEVQKATGVDVGGSGAGKDAKDVNKQGSADRGVDDPAGDPQVSDTAGFTSDNVIEDTDPSRKSDEARASDEPATISPTQENLEGENQLQRGPAEKAARTEQRIEQLPGPTDTLAEGVGTAETVGRSAIRGVTQIPQDIQRATTVGPADFVEEQIRGTRQARSGKVPGGIQGAIAAGANPNSLRAEAAENRQKAVGTQLALAGAGAAAAPAIGTALARGASRTETDVTTKTGPVKTRSEASGTEATLDDTPFNQRTLGEELGRKQTGETADVASNPGVVQPDSVVQSRRRTRQQPDTRRPDTREEQTDVEFQDQDQRGEDLLQVSEEAASRTQLRTAQDRSSDFTAPASEADDTLTLSQQEASILAEREGASSLNIAGFTDDGGVEVEVTPEQRSRVEQFLSDAQSAVEDPNALGSGAGSLVQEKRPEVSSDSLRDLFGDTSRPGDSLPDPAGRGRPERPDLSAATRNRGGTDTISPSDVTTVAPTVAVGQTQETSTTQNTQTTTPENQQDQTPFNREIQEQPQGQAQGQDTGLNTDLDTTPFAFQTNRGRTRQDTPFPGSVFSNPEPGTPTSTTPPNQGSGTPFQAPDFDTQQPREQEAGEDSEAVFGEEAPAEAQFGLVGASIIQSRGQEVESFELEESQRTEINLLSGFQPSTGGDLL